MELILLPVLLGFGLLFTLVGGGDGDDADTAEPDPGTDDEIVGTDAYDTLDGGAGDDILSGLRGFDDLSGGTGNDTLEGDDGKDLLEGGAGNDELYGGAWHDGLFGGAGSDGLAGGNGDDILVGGAGEDELFGDLGGDVLIGGSGTDYLHGGDGDDLLVGAQVLSRDLTAEDFEAVRAAANPADVVFPDFGLTGTSDAGGNLLSGEAGDDIFFLGNNDLADGDEGLDSFFVGDWIDAGQAPTINNFIPGDDVVVVAYDDTGPAPLIEFANDAPGEATITLDGQIIANLTGTFAAITPADIFITPYAPA